jgi:hypothetical protein
MIHDGHKLFTDMVETAQATHVHTEKHPNPVVEIVDTQTQHK